MNFALEVYLYEINRLVMSRKPGVKIRLKPAGFEMIKI